MEQQYAGLILPLLVGVGSAVGLFTVVRWRRIRRLRAKVHGHVPLPVTFKDVLKEVFTPEVTEAGAVGAVTFVDLAWQYSLADPAIWDNIGAEAASRLADVGAHMQVLEQSFGGAAHTLVDTLQGIEAAQVFGDMLHTLPAFSDAGAVVLEAKSEGVVDALMDTAASTDTLADAADSTSSGVLLHIPLITIGFASYRAWRRSQHGAGLKRNVEFATIEVITRAGGGLAGAQVGGTVGTVIAPGVGTFIGTVAGAIAGTLGGAALGEAVKKQHVERATRDLDNALNTLGEAYLADKTRFAELVDVFKEQERHHTQTLDDTRHRLKQYRTPWRALWPTEKLILLEETVKLAEKQLIDLREGTVDALDKLQFMRMAEKHRELGMMLAGNPALHPRLEGDLLREVTEANDRLHHEMRQLGTA